jgi:hypothetical protein
VGGGVNEKKREAYIHKYFNSLGHKWSQVECVKFFKKTDGRYGLLEIAITPEFKNDYKD